VSKATTVLYKPLGLGVSVFAGVLAGAVFKQVWKLVADEEEAPEATDSSYGWGEVLIAAALQGATFAVVKALVNRGSAAGVRRLTGTWPGE
jgi:predicted metal-dependent enzyme (double-stranded beta helix superfamily)